MEYYSAFKKQIVICDNVDEHGKLYTNWNKLAKETNSIWSHFYVDLELFEPIQ
jgi:hypothetical protein